MYIWIYTYTICVPRIKRIYADPRNFGVTALRCYVSPSQLARATRDAVDIYIYIYLYIYIYDRWVDTSYFALDIQHLIPEMDDESRRFVWKGMPPSAAGLETGFRLFSVTIRITGAIAIIHNAKSRFCSSESLSQRGVLPSFAHFQKADLIDWPGACPAPKGGAGLGSQSTHQPRKSGCVMLKWFEGYDRKPEELSSSKLFSFSPGCNKQGIPPIGILTRTHAWSSAFFLSLGLNCVWGALDIGRPDSRNLRMRTDRLKQLSGLFSFHLAFFLVVHCTPCVLEHDFQSLE